MSLARPTSDRVLAQARFEARNVLANGEQLLVSLLLPIVTLIGLTVSDVLDVTVGPWSELDRVGVVVPGVLALAVISTALTGQAILLGYERRYGVQRLLGTTPLGRGGLIAGKCVAVLAVVALQTVVIAALGLALGWRPEVSGLVIAPLLLVLGSACFVALAVVVGGALRAEAVLALANVLWVGLLAVGGILIPPAAMPQPLASIVAWSPSGLLADGLRSALSIGDAGIPLVVVVLALLGWTLALTWLARQLLRWSD